MFQLLSFILFLTVVSSLPLATFPINAQVPPVVRNSEPYNFEFSSQTFTSNIASNISYSLSGAPSWLAVDSATHTLSGTPNDIDAGTLAFQLWADDGDGSLSMNVSLAVMDMTAQGPGPESGVAFLEQLNDFGTVVGDDSISVYAGDSFNLPFGTNAFTGGPSQYYYATSGDRSPLPSWLTFDSGTVSFSGIAPPQISYPQNFPVLIIASAVEGFAEATLLFNIVISEHQLAFKPYEQNVAIKQSHDVLFTALRAQLFLDGVPISNQDLQNATATAPFWLNFDPQTLVIAGNAPSGEVSQDVTVLASDRFGNQAEALVHFQFGASIFSRDIGTINATIGKPFTYNFTDDLVNHEDYRVTVDLGNASKWLTFDPKSLTIRGLVPAKTKPEKVRAEITATTNSSTVNESQFFLLQIVPASTTTGPTTITSIPTSSSPGNSEMTPSQGSYSSQGTSTPGQLGKGGLAAVIVIPILLAIVLVVVLFFCCFRKKSPGLSRRGSVKAKGGLMGNIARRTTKIRNTITGKRMSKTDLERNAGEPMRGPQEMLHHRTNLPPPVPIRSPNRTSDGSILDPNSQALLDAERGSLGMVGPSDYSPYDPLGIATRRRTATHSHRERRHVSSTTSRRSAGLPIERRLTGIGHGRPLGGVSEGAVQKRPCGRISRSQSPRSSETFSSLESSFPYHRPIPRARMRQAAGRNVRDSIRLVDDRPFEEKRRSYLRGRASSSNLNPLFAASSGTQRYSTDSQRYPSSKAMQASVEMASNFGQEEAMLEEELTDSNWETSASACSSYEGVDVTIPDQRSSTEPQRQSVIQNWSRKLNIQPRDSSDSHPRHDMYDHDAQVPAPLKFDERPSTSREPLPAVQNNSRPISWLERLGKGTGEDRSSKRNSFEGNEAFM